MEIFKIKREEWPVIAVGILLFALLQWLMVQYRYDAFTHGWKGGFYSIFMGHIVVSGYDEYTYITLSKWRILYRLARHPLLALFLFPFSQLNEWMMAEWHMNFAIIIWAAILLVSDILSLHFLYRIERDIVGVGRYVAALLTILFFSFGHIMVSSFMCDHFGLSMMLLLMTLYIAGRHLQQQRPMPAWQAALLFLLTSGVTLTNGVKTALAALFCGGRKVFRWRYVLVAAILPVTFLGATFYLQDEYIVKPDKEWGQRMLQRRIARDSTLVERMKRQSAVIERNKVGNLGDNDILDWTDTKHSRLDAVVENLFGESLQLHEDYLLQDVNRTRPIIVRYRHWWNYAVEATLLLLFLAGLWKGRRNRFLQLCLSWFLFDLVLHLGFGFGIIEVYIMTAHWAFILPIAIGYLLKSLELRVKSVGFYHVSLISLHLLTLFLLAWNLRLLFRFFLW